MTGVLPRKGQTCNPINDTSVTSRPTYLMAVSLSSKPGTYGSVHRQIEHGQHRCVHRSLAHGTDARPWVELVLSNSISSSSGNGGKGTDKKPSYPFRAHN